MKLIAGLGNPGQEYADTRHNLGFRVVDVLAQRSGFAVDRTKFRGLVGDGGMAGERVMLLKPMTYMNHSGASVLEAWQFYKLEPAGLLIVLDDLDLPLGQLRFRRTGASGGHRGLADILRCLGTEDVPRLRVGIGAARGDAADHVLSRFASDEREVAEIAVQSAADAVECWVSQGPETTMNRFNRGVD